MLILVLPMHEGRCFVIYGNLTGTPLVQQLTNLITIQKFFKSSSILRTLVFFCICDIVGNNYKIVEHGYIFVNKLLLGK